MKYLLKHKPLAAFIFILCFAFSAFAQESKFDNALKFITKTQPHQHLKIDSVFKAFKHDSLKMKRLKNVSKDRYYFEGVSYALNALGEIQRNISNYDASIRLHQEANTYAKKGENVELNIISLNMLGVAYRRMDIVKPALDYHTKALKIAYTVTNPSKTVKHSIAVSQNSIGNIYLALKQYDLAISQFSKSLKLEEELNNELGLAINYHNIAYAQEANGDLDIALSNYQLSLKYNNSIDSEIGRVICYNSIGGIYLKQKNYKEAAPIIKVALEKALELEDQFYITSSYINLGQLELEMEQCAIAEEHLEKAYQIAKSYNLKSAVAESSKLLSELSQNNNKFE